jgi:(3S)-malyl-CoA thioesterase
MQPLRLCRSVLFLPASNPRAIEKARSVPADLVILDLEDAVREEDKASARAAAVEATHHGFEGKLVAIRVNADIGHHFGDDAVAVRSSAADFVVLPKAETAKKVQDAASLSQKPVLAMIETAGGVLAAREIAAHARGLIAGTNDLAADLAIPPDAGRAGLMHALQSIVLAARAAGIAAFDGVFNGLDDSGGLEAECREGRAFGFDGKSLIHPNQIETANHVFSPSSEEVAAAERLIAAATGGAERHEGRMIEAMHVAQAKAVLAKARR